MRKKRYVNAHPASATEREREILNFYLEHERQLNGFRELKYFINQLDITRLEEDLKLIKRFLEKVETSDNSI